MACDKSCLDEIVTVSDLCHGERLCSLSGLDLMDAPEISTTNLALIANEKYISGLKLAREILLLATKLLKNDFIAMLNTNGILANVSNMVYTSAYLNSATTIPTAPLERGQTLFRSEKIRGNLRRLMINKVEFFPMTSGIAQLSIYDGDTVARYNIELVAGENNIFDLGYVVKGAYARVVLDNTNITMMSTKISCKTGCNNTMPNPCGYIESYDGYREMRTDEGYGLNIYFSCICDYDQFLCSLSQTYIGELIWLKARILLLDERLNSNRLNDWIVYGREDMVDLRNRLSQEYIDKWNSLVAGMYSILRTYRDDCLLCRGSSWKVNG